MSTKLSIFMFFTLCVLSVTIQGQTESTRRHTHATSATPHHPPHSTTARFYPRFCHCNCCAGYQCTPFPQGIVDYHQSGAYCTDNDCQSQCALRYPTSCSINIPYGTTNIYCDY